MSFSERALPHSIEAEMDVLGACMMSAVGRMVVLQELTDKDFFAGKHAALFRVIVSLDERGPVSFVEIADRLQTDADAMREVGGLETPMRCLDACLHTDNPENSIRILQEKAHRRRLILSLLEARTVAEDELRPVDETQALVEAKVLGARAPVSTAFDLDEWADRVEQETVLTAEGHEARERVRTGFYDLDRRLKMWQRRLTVLAAATSAGKTATALNIIAHVVKAGKRVYLWSGEIDAEEIHERLAAAECGLEYERLQERRLTKTELQVLRDHTAVVKQWPLIIRDTPMSVAEIRADCRHIATTQGPIGLIDVDYLSLVKDLQEVESGDRRDVRVGGVVWRLKLLARELESHCLLVHQFNREFSKRATSRPRTSDLRDSGVIEQHADNVLLLYRPERDESLSEADRQRYLKLVEAIIAKQRAGRVGSVWLLFNGDTQQLQSLAREQWPSGPPQPAATKGR